jgi:hypothetical protein
MTTHRIGRLRIRPGPGPDSADRARRLARVACDRLGHELDRALAGAPEDHHLDVDRIVVRIPVDPRELDDDALALLWASLIRDAVAAFPAARGEVAGDPLGDRPAAVSADEPAALAAALLAWAKDSVPPPEPVLARLRSSAGLLTAALALLPQSWREPARGLMIGSGPAAPGPDWTAAVTAEPAGSADGRPTPPTHRHSTSRSRRPAATADRAMTDPPPSPPGDAAVPPSPLRSQRMPSPQQVPPPQQGAVPRSAAPMSAYGGLALLFVRLRPLLERATAEETNRDPVAVRTAVLALVANAQDPELALPDALVRLLAGDPDWRRPALAAPMVLADPASATEAADDALRAFARDLPGFGRSTPQFVRDEWVRRGGTLLQDGSEVLLHLGRRPLDLVLDRLPYPTGALRFPWTPTVLVGWEAP